MGQKSLALIWIDPAQAFAMALATEPKLGCVVNYENGRCGLGATERHVHVSIENGLCGHSIIAQEAVCCGA